MIYPKTPCPLHASHVIESPLCQRQTFCRKVFNVAFNVITLGIPYTLQHYFPKTTKIICEITSYLFSPLIRLISFFNPFKNCCNKNEDNLKTITIKYPNQHITLVSELFPKTDLPIVCHEALMWVQEACSEITLDISHSRIHPEIQLIYALYEKNNNAFRKAMFAHKQLNNPWKNEEVCRLAGNMMKISYVIAFKTLEFLPTELEDKWKERNNENGESVNTLADLLVCQRSYQFRSILEFSQVYHWLRSGVQVSMGPDYENGGSVESINFPHETALEHAEEFYQEGSQFDSWRQLYNDACRQIRKSITEYDLYRADTRFYNWTREDHGIYTFRQIPDTLPT